MSWSQLQAARYVSLGTFRRNGTVVNTPVWAAPLQARLYVFSEGHAGKVKRLRNGSRAQLAVCDVRGRLRGDWVTAVGELVSDPAEIHDALQALKRKYGWQMTLLNALSRISGKYNQRAYIRLSAGEDA